MYSRGWCVYRGGGGCECIVEVVGVQWRWWVCTVEVVGVSVLWRWWVCTVEVLCVSALRKSSMPPISNFLYLITHAFPSYQSSMPYIHNGCGLNIQRVHWRMNYTRQLKLTFFKTNIGALVSSTKIDLSLVTGANNSP